jgi:type IV secretion system protein TrbL
VRDRVASAGDAGGTPDTSSPSSDASDKAPAWAQRLQRRQRVAHGASTAAHVVRSADHGGGGAAPELRDSSNE